MSVERLQAAGAQILSYFSSKYSHLYQSHPWLTLIGSAIISYNLYASLLEKLRLPNLNKRAVFITGCDFGMGRVAAIELAKLGVPVFAGCLSDEAIVSIEQESVKLKGEIIGVKCDITSDDDVRNAVETVRSHLKNGVKLWAVINNAGVFSTFGPAEWCSVDVYKKAMELNFYGAVRVSNAFLPLIRESHGRISVTTSVAARIGIMGGSPYSCAKVALNHFAEAANVENRVFGVYFGIIEPGIFKTTLLDNEAKRKRVNSVWETLDPSIKEVYGEEYKEKFIDDWNKVMNDQGSADISPVIWSYVHFVTARYPRFRYQAGANSKWLWGKLALLPSNWFHRLVPTISGEPLVPAYMQPKKEFRAERTLIFVSLLTLLFIIAELIGGYLAHSLAIVSDAFHMISDLGSFLISITAIHLARKKPTARYSYGFQRTEVLGALTSILIIWILTGVLIYMAIERILTNDLEVEADTMMITAGIGVVFNMVMGVCLYFGKAGHSHFGMSHSHHHHGHSHGHGQKVSNVENLSEKTIKSIDEEAHQHHHSHHHHHQENINLRAAFVHVLGDLVQSMGVLLAAVIIKFTGFTLADPICTFLFGVLVLLTTHGIFKDTILVLMEATPNHVSMNKVHEDLTSIDGVSSIHSLRIWSLKLDSTAISVHLDIQPGADVSAVVRQAQHKLQHEHGIDYITVQAQCSLSNASSEVQLLGV